MENPYGTTTILPNNYYQNNNSSSSSISPHHSKNHIISASSSSSSPPTTSSVQPQHQYNNINQNNRPSSLNNYDNIEGGRDGGGLYRANQKIIFCCQKTSGILPSQPQQNKQNQQQLVSTIIQKNQQQQQNELLILSDESNNNKNNNANNNNTINIVDPPRPPFIPKKPVFYASTNCLNNNNKLETEAKIKMKHDSETASIYKKEASNYQDASTNQKHFLQQMQHSPKMKHASKFNFDHFNNSNNASKNSSSSIYHRNNYNKPPPPLPHRYYLNNNQQNNNIYSPPITSTTITNTAITTTYIGGGSIEDGVSTIYCNKNNSSSNNKEKCSNNNSEEKNSSTDGSSTNCSTNNENEACCYSKEIASINNKLLKMGQPTCFEIAEKLKQQNNNNNNNCTSYFPVVEQQNKNEISASVSASNNIIEATALITEDLRARFRSNQNKSKNNNLLIKRHSSSTYQKHHAERRLSLIGSSTNSSHQEKNNCLSNATISSFGCSDAGKTREGRIYATAGFGGAAAAARNRRKKLKNNLENNNNNNDINEEEIVVKFRQESICGSLTCLNNNDISQLNCSNLLNNKNDQNYSGTLKSNSGASLGAFSLGNEYSCTTVGKSTLGRRAQKLAQRAALKLSKSGGTLSTELSNSASAIYALFSGNNSEKYLNEENNNNNSRPTSVNNDEFILTRKKGSKKNKNGRKLELMSSSCYWMDKTTNVSKHTAKGIDFLENFGLFIKERAQIEEEYATKLKNLSKKSRGKKASDDEFTSASAFYSVLGELESLASQHELVGERLRDVLLPQIIDKCRQLRSVRKKHSQGFELMEKDYNCKVDELHKQKKNYEKTHIDAQNAFIKYKRADANRYLSRHDVDKAKTTANNKATVCEQGKQYYASQLALTNSAKSDFYNILLPKLLEEMRQLEIERINFTRLIMLESVKAETDVLHIIQRCYDDMNIAINTINPNHDTLLVVDQTKTGYAHPADFEFEDLGTTEICDDDTASFDNSTIRRIGAKNVNGKGLPRKHSLKLFNNSIGNKSNGNSSTGGSHTSSGSNTGEYGNLPPQQRCRRIQKKLEELANELSIKENSKDGLERLLSVYSNDPKMGDPQTVEKQIEHNKCEIDSLNEQINRFKNILKEAQSELNQPLGGGGGGSSSISHLNTTTNSTISSTPNSSPRGSSCSGGGNNLNNINGNIPLNNGNNNIEQRGSYSEASSISSADGAGSSSLHSQITTNCSSISTTRLPQLSQHQQPPPPLSTGQQIINSTEQKINSINLNNKNNNLNNDNLNNNGGDFYEECDGPVNGNGLNQHSDMILGTALARYHYDATPDEAGGTIITMNEGDELLLLEKDMGDGWTRVRHRISNAEGFVPTSYLDCKWYGASTSR